MLDNHYNKTKQNKTTALTINFLKITSSIIQEEPLHTKINNRPRNGRLENHIILQIYRDRPDIRHFSVFRFDNRPDKSRPNIGYPASWL